jgi:hypothetical protein
MRMLSWLFRRDKPDVDDERLALREHLDILIEEGRKSTFGWNDADTAKLQALWNSDRFPKPSVTFNDQGDVWVCPELAKELGKPGNEGLTELLFSLGKQGAAIERRKREREG